jgi:hypothetical protein
MSEAYLARNPEPKGSPYYIGPVPRVVRVPLAEVPAEPTVEPTPGQRAEAFLRDVLTPDPVPVTQVEAMAADAQVKPRTLRRARAALKVQTYKRGGQWWLKLPDDEDGPVKGGRIPARPRRRKSIAGPLA